MVEPIRLLIADRYPCIREGIEHALDGDQAMTIVGQATAFDQIDDWRCQRQPHVLIVSLNLLPNPIIEAVTSVQAHYPATKQLIYADTCDSLCLQSLLDARVSGCVLKEEPVDEVVTAIQAIANGGTHFSRLALTNLTQTEDETILNPLTEREREVLQLVTGGMNNKQIAKTLSITTRTVKFHASNIYSKLGGLSRAEAIAWTWKNGMVNEEAA